MCNRSDYRVTCLFSSTEVSSLKQLHSKNQRVYIEPVRVLWPGIDLEPLIVRFGTSPIEGSLKEPRKGPY